jgi:hypothetical protein
MTAALTAFDDDPLLRIATAAHLARYQGASRVHTESDLLIFFRWCQDRQIRPLTARRLDIELSSDGCRKCADSSHPRCRAGSLW